jgi:predicted dehydrogenase
MKKVSISILGFGQRGLVYANALKEHPESIELIAVCEQRIEKHASIQTEFNVDSSKMFTHVDVFFQAGKLSDILVISTMDQDHYNQSMRALDLGYDILLEKPIALSKEHIYAIKKKANLLNRKVAIAHVLRYTLFYQKIKETIDSGVIGQIATMTQTENVGYFHYAHSYVRGNWHDEKKSSPMILAKSCHDLDIIRYLMGHRVHRLSSFGNLFYFKKENAPVGSTSHCVDCKVDCPFNAITFYKNNPKWLRIFTQNPNVDEVFQDKSLNYGKCVYRMDNNVVDHQVVQMEFENGATASFTMTGFSNENHRTLTLHGTHGELNGDMDKKLIHVKPYGKAPYTIDLRDFTTDFSDHGGGDKLLFMDFVQAVRDNNSFLTNINDSVESHFLAFDAEKSRLHHGSVIDMSTQWEMYQIETEEKYNK